MKICYVCYTDLGLEKAALVHILEVVNNLSKLDHDIDLFAPKLSGYNQDISAKITYLKIINKPVLWVISYEITLFFNLLKYLLTKKPDILYARQSDSSLSPFLLSRLFNIPIIAENNGDLVKEATQQDCSRMRVAGMKIIERICFKISKKIITVSPGLKNTIIKRHKIKQDKIIVIRNGVNTDLFRPLNIKKVRSENGLSEDLHYIGYSGNLAVWQGVEYLIKSLPVVLKKIPDVRYIIVGDGTEKQKLIKLTKKIGLGDKIIFTGRLPYKTVARFINAFDICVAPFIRGRFQDASPLKLYEYFACGKPVIISCTDGIIDIDRETAVFFEPENEKELAARIVELIEDPQMRERLGKQGRNFVLNGHTWKDVAGQIDEVLNEVIKSHKNI